MFYKIFNVKDVYINWLKDKNTIVFYNIWYLFELSRLQPAIWCIEIKIDYKINIELLH